MARRYFRIGPRSTIAHKLTEDLVDDTKEFIASMIKTVRDRLGNPLISAFVISWLIWNFRVVLVLIGSGDGGWRAKINYLDSQLMVGWSAWPLHGLLVPLGIALVWIFAMPGVLRRVAVFHEGPSHVTKAEVLKALEKAPISEEERIGLWASMAKERKQFAEIVSELNKAIEQMQREQAPLQIPADSATAPAEDIPTVRARTRDSLPNDDDGDFFGARWEDQATAIGLKLVPVIDQVPSLGTPYVDFNDRQIRWPWKILKSGNAGLSSSIASKLDGRTFNQLDICVLYAIRNANVVSVREAADFDMDAFQFQVGLDTLSESGLVSRISSSEYEISPNGRIFLAWLLTLGFEISVATPAMRSPARVR
jgi:hypothetical protein